MFRRSYLWESLRRLAWGIARTSMLTVFLLSSPPLSAQEPLAAPQGPVILSVTGDLGRTNGAQRADFDIDMLKERPSAEIVTSTPWTDGTIAFTGVPLADLIDELGIDGGTLRAIALNNYAVEIPVSDAGRGNPIIAYARDGALMSVRDKGPLWVIYPFDEGRALRNEEIQARSIWQLRTIEVRK
ncbi:MAG: oxidoreductase [Pseudomonadota bacterium]